MYLFYHSRELEKRLFLEEFHDGEFKREGGNRRVADALGGGEEGEHSRMCDSCLRRQAFSFSAFGGCEFLKNGKG